MAELEVLHQEPRHLVTSLADEIKERRRLTIQSMRPALQALIVGLCDYLEGMKDDIPHLEYDRVVLAETRWMKDGRFIFEFGYQRRMPADLGERLHVDDLLTDIVKRNSRLAPLFDEFSRFLAALVDQFSALKKSHLHVSLDKITFTNPRGLDKDLIFDIKLDGKAFGPKEVRW